MKKLSVKDLIASKDKFKNRKAKTQEYEVPSLEGNIVIKEPDRDMAIEITEMAMTAPEKADLHAVYHSVIEPDLKNAELQKEYGCVEPTDIVKMIFSTGEIASIAGEAIKLAGYGEGIKKVRTDLKN